MTSYIRTAATIQKQSLSAKKVCRRKRVPATREPNRLSRQIIVQSAVLGHEHKMKVLPGHRYVKSLETRRHMSEGQLRRYNKPATNTQCSIRSKCPSKCPSCRCSCPSQWTDQLVAAAKIVGMRRAIEIIKQMQADEQKTRTEMITKFKAVIPFVMNTLVKALTDQFKTQIACSKK